MHSLLDFLAQLQSFYPFLELKDSYRVSKGDMTLMIARELIDWL